MQSWCGISGANDSDDSCWCEISMGNLDVDTWCGILMWDHHVRIWCGDNPQNVMFFVGGDTSINHIINPHQENKKFILNSQKSLSFRACARCTCEKLFYTCVFFWTNHHRVRAANQPVPWANQHVIKDYVYVRFGILMLFPLFCPPTPITISQNMIGKNYHWQKTQQTP